MADLVVECYSSIAGVGHIQVQDVFLGKVTISTLSSTSQSSALLAGTRYVKLATDATEAVYFTFGTDSATAGTDDQEIRADLSEKVLYAGTNGNTKNTIAARIA